MKIRCAWPSNDLDIKYHDEEWGVPVHDDIKLFEFITLEGAQAGLSWSTILKKRDGYRAAFANFDLEKVSNFTEKNIEDLMLNPNIIRNRLKITSTINNAKIFLKIQKEFGSFSKYIWSFVNYKPIQNKFKDLSEIPAKTEISDLMSKDMKKRGFKFVGSTICYAFMQATGMVNDHSIGCFRYNEIIYSEFH